MSAGQDQRVHRRADPARRAPGPHGDPRRRRGPRERGRSLRRGRARNAGRDQLHGGPRRAGWSRSRSPRSACARSVCRSSPTIPATRRSSAPRSRRPSTRAKAWARACRRTTARAPSRSRSPRARARPISSARARLQTLRAVDGGVLARRGHTEAAVDLARLAGLKPAGVICEIMKEDGTHGAHAGPRALRRAGTACGSCASPISSPTAGTSDRSAAAPRRRCRRARPGNFRLMVYGDNLETQAFVALVKGDGASRPAGAGAAAFAVPDRRRVRVERCDCGEQLDAALADDGAGGQRRARLHVRRGARHRAPEQDSRLRAAGPGPRHRGGQPRAGIRAPTCATTRPARTSCSTSACAQRPPHDEQSRQGAEPRGVRPRRSPSACRSRSRPGRRTAPTSTPSARSSATFCPLSPRTATRD